MKNMKKITFLFLTLHCLGSNALVAQNTNYGAFSGTGGGNNSFFGYYTGNATTAGPNTALGAYSMYTNTAGYQNTATGYYSLYANTSGLANTATGHGALNNNTIGNYNTGTGFSALAGNISGSFNTANGPLAMASNSTGSYNVAISRALVSNTTGNYNIATGYEALNNNTIGSFNAAVGNLALYSNLDGDGNAAIGYKALYQNTSGRYNFASGYLALSANVNGNYNIGIGYAALINHSGGDSNTGVGNSSLYSNTTGTFNSALGTTSLYNNTTGSNNTAVGYSAGPNTGNLSNTTAIGYNSRPTSSNHVRIGNSSVTSIGGQVGWSTLSDGRFKFDLREDIPGLDFVNQLRPVSYAVNKQSIDKFLRIEKSESSEQDASREKPARETGFVAQEVHKIVKENGFAFNGIDVPEDESIGYYSIKYSEFVVPLVKAVQELNAKVEDQQKKIELLTSQLLDKSEQNIINGLQSKEVGLLQNSPNPFSSDTEIGIVLPDNAGHASVIIYNLAGTQLKEMQVNERGTTKVRISGNELNAGMYIYALIVDGKIVDSKRMILTK
jgi:hypothetical protein